MNQRMPVIFVGHGSPMSALANNHYSQAWKELGKTLIKPRAILVISAHWYIEETAVSDISEPKQIYDFYGFPDELYNLKYNPVGSRELAQEIIKILEPLTSVKINNDWGVDHGAWIPLLSFFPDADVPVVQLSLDLTKTSDEHYRIGQALKKLRNQDILIVASGDMVHNLGLIKYQEDSEPYDWAQSFEDKLIKLISSDDHKKLINYQDLGPEANLAIPTPDHYWPLLYALGLKESDEKVEYFVKGIAYGSVSMTSFIIK